MNNKKSQCEAILDYLQKGNSITPLEALHQFGCMRLGARIWDLKREGHEILTEFDHDPDTGKTYARYSLLTTQLSLAI